MDNEIIQHLMGILPEINIGGQDWSLPIFGGGAALFVILGLVWKFGRSAVGLAADAKTLRAPEAESADSAQDKHDVLMAELASLKEQVKQATAPQTGEAEPEREARKAEAVDNAVQSGDAEEIEAIREIASGDVSGGLDDMEALARRIEAEGNARAAQKWRDIGALAYDRAPMRALEAYREATRLDGSDFISWIFRSRLERSHGGQTAAALEAAREAQAVAGDDREKSIALSIFGDAAMQAGDLPAARVAYDESLTLAKALLAANPDSAEAKRDMSVTHEKVANAAMRAGDLPAARAAYDDSLTLAKTLLAANPTSAQAKRDMLVSYAKVAQALDDKSYWQQALPIVEDMAAAGQLAPVDEWMLEDIRSKAAE